MIDDIDTEMGLDTDLNDEVEIVDVIAAAAPSKVMVGATTRQQVVHQRSMTIIS